MKKLVAIILAGSLVGCAAYRITLKEDRGLAAAVQRAGSDAPIQVSKENRVPEGFQCFEPMLFFLTVGLIPVHCVDTYKASAAELGGESIYTVTAMQGWVTLVLMPLPGWHFGFGRNPQPEIESLARKRNK